MKSTQRGVWVPTRLSLALRHSQWSRALPGCLRQDRGRL